MTIRRLCVLAMLLALAVSAAAQPGSAVLRLGSGIDLDDAGRALRQAVTAWEQAASGPAPGVWTTYELSPHRSVQLGTDLHLMLMGVEANGARVMVVDADGPHQTTLSVGQEATLGALRVIAIASDSRRDSARVMIRSVESAPRLLDPPAGNRSPTRIHGYENPNRLVVEAPDGRTAEFCRAFVEQYNRTGDARRAADAAWEAVPPPSRPGRSAALGDGGARGHEGGLHDLSDVAASLPHTAVVTLRVVRGESSALRTLTGEVAYDSTGTGTRNPRVTGTAGADGGTVTVGSQGDRVRARLHALEREGRVNVESENLVRVPVGGRSSFRLHGSGGSVSGTVTARRAGRDAVELAVNQSSGDASFLGSVSTTGRFTDGQSRVLAQRTASRTASVQSGPPIVGQIPYAGPMIGSSASSREESSYVLIATVQLER